MSRYLKNQSGETIVEVLVSFVLLLMFTALFVVSLRYARARRPMHSAKSCTPPEMESPNG